MGEYYVKASCVGVVSAENEKDAIIKMKQEILPCFTNNKDFDFKVIEITETV